MSRRYGRNQRRRAREQVAQLEAQAVVLDQRTRRAEINAAQLRCQLDDVREALGPHFMGLPPQMLAGEIWRLYELDRARLPGPSGDAVEVRAMTFDCIVDSTHQTNFLHFLVRLAGGKAAYAISSAALLNAPAEAVARQIGRQIATRLVRDLRSAGLR
ncbi:hypothetical protein [Stenotrophomonas sp. SY1]|uniref:hypothetical protein n=1 Tax=Stenotrophomonas sp. SY1 TaxID=477235 RepID=UPI001E351522|nr:hypothetical protein [Stenotrophomonas sp. SY1]MCD9087396.1 hypothetical protein [Stenotrophomonas sp. SY1]